MNKLIILFLIIAIIGCDDRPKKPLQKPFKLKVAYTVLFDEQTDNYEIFSMDMDGSNPTNISNLEGVEWAYYAFEDQVYFASDRDMDHRVYQLFKMKADGSQKTKISDIRLDDSWHSSRKNGSEIIVKPHQSIDTAFFIIDSSGTVLKKIKPKLRYFSDPSFSPDGKKIAFRGALTLPQQDSSFIDEIYSMDADGTNLQQLTKYPKNDTTAAWFAYRAAPPRWHPTENFISYSSFQNGKYSLYGVTPDGSKQWKLTHNEQGEVYHDWSPDGNWLVTDLAVDDSPPYTIGLVDWKTKETQVLTDTIYKYQQAPVFVTVYD